MRIVLALVMFTNALLFFFGALQHTGLEIASFREPVIIPAAIVESICGISLVWGSLSLLAGIRRQWAAALLANAFALGGVLLGIVALALGAGPRTPTNDLYHRAMLGLIAASLLIVWFSRRNPSSTSRGRTSRAAGVR